MNDASVNPGLLLRRTIKTPLRIFLWKNSERIDDVNWYLIPVIVDNYPRQRLAVNSTLRSFPVIGHFSVKYEKVTGERSEVRVAQ